MVYSRTPSIHKRQCIALCLSLAAATTTTTTAFTSPQVTSSWVAKQPHQQRVNNGKFQTQLYVGGKWQLPFLGIMEEEKHDEAAAFKSTPLPLLSSFFHQDTAEEANEKMGNLVDFIDDDKQGGLQTKDDAANLLPLFGAIAVALAVVGASVSGIVYVILLWVFVWLCFVNFVDLILSSLLFDLTMVLSWLVSILSTLTIYTTYWAIIKSV